MEYLIVWQIVVFSYVLLTRVKIQFFQTKHFIYLQGFFLNLAKIKK